MTTSANIDFFWDPVWPFAWITSRWVTKVTSAAPYFAKFRSCDAQRWVFAEELTAAADAIQAAETRGPVFVNRYSTRHYFDYSTLEFLLEGTPGIDRAPPDQGLVVDPPLDLIASIERSQLFVLVGDYTANLAVLRDLYPQGSLLVDVTSPRVVVYEVTSAQAGS